jgi:hypothetical protein
VKGSRGVAALPALCGERILSAAVVDLQSWTVQTHGRGLALSAPEAAEPDATAVPIARGQTVLIGPPPVLSQGGVGPASDVATIVDRAVSAAKGVTGGVVAAIHRPMSHRREGAA